MIAPHYPAALEPASWLAHKAVLAKAHVKADLCPELRALERAHRAVDWDLFGIEGLDSAEDATQRKADIEAECGGPVKALLKAAEQARAEARTLVAPFKADALLKDAPARMVAEVVDAASVYARQVNERVEAARSAVEKRRLALVATVKPSKAPLADPKLTQVAALVRGRLIAGLKAIRNARPGMPPLKFIAGLASVHARVAIGSSVGHSQKAQLMALLPDEDGVKWIRGDCLWEDKAVTFVCENPPSGAGKRLQRGLLEQTQARLKVRVRKPDGEVETCEGVDDPAAFAPGEADAAGAQPSASKPAPDKAVNAADVAPIKDRREAGAAELRLRIDALLPAIGQLRDDTRRREHAGQVIRFNQAILRLPGMADGPALKAIEALRQKVDELQAQLDAAREAQQWMSGTWNQMRDMALEAAAACPVARAGGTLAAAVRELDAQGVAAAARGELDRLKAEMLQQLRQCMVVAKAIGQKKAQHGQALAALRMDLIRLDALRVGAKLPLVDPLYDHMDYLGEKFPEGTSVQALQDSMAGFQKSMDELRMRLETIRESIVQEHAHEQPQRIETALGRYREAVLKLGDAARTKSMEAELSRWRERVAQSLKLRNPKGRSRQLLSIHAEIDVQYQLVQRTLLKAQVQTPKGRQALDSKVLGMGDATDDPEAMAFCEAALEARFGIEVQGTADMRQKSLPRVYAMLAKVPEWQTHQGSLKTLTFRTEELGGGGSCYVPSMARIALDQIWDSVEHTLVPEVDPKTKAVDVSYFNFTTLHEVGHSVDDHIGFMSSRMGHDAFGGWRTETLNSTVEWLGREGGFYARHESAGCARVDLKIALTQWLTQRRCPKPKSATGPLGTLLARWEQIEADPTIAQCRLGMRSADEPWMGHSARAAQLAVAGRVFHESYPRRWVSYTHAARAATGVSAYQWRAAGEWFAELYGLYYLGKLAPSHPMHAWFAGAANPEATAKAAS